jgi:hypothetical protein
MNIVDSVQKKKTLVVARSWRTFENQQVVAIANFLEVFSPHFDVVFYLCINDSSADIDHYVRILEKAGCSPKIFFKNNQELDNYALSKGAALSQITKFKHWQWIYHLILYHYLYHEQGIDYLLTYDDDIFFQGDLKEVIELLHDKTPFAIQDHQSDSDKCTMGKLVEYFGASLIDGYYECRGSIHSSNSCFMGIDIEKIFSNFTPGHEFFQMLEMFQYEPEEYGSSKEWREYKIPLQEQSFLSILSRATSEKAHVLLTPDFGYSMEDLENSMVQHYTGELKYQKDFLDRVHKKYVKILENDRNSHLSE